MFFVHLRHPVVVHCPEKGQLTIFAREDEDVHALEAHEGTTSLSLPKAQELIRQNGVQLNIEQAIILEMEACHE